MIKIYFYFFDKISIKFLENLIHSLFSIGSFSFIYLPKKKKKITILKAPHVHKKAKEHFEIVTYKRLLILSADFTKEIILLLSLLPNNIRCKVKYYS